VENNPINSLAGLHAVEILSIDTEQSRAFFEAVGANPSEKCECQSLLGAAFRECCEKYGGVVASNWQGDGGRAYFRVADGSGNSVLAAREFLSKLPALTQQTSTALAEDEQKARRRFRLAAHFGNVYLTSEGSFDAGRAADFDNFLRNEREFAPVPDQLFVTAELYRMLSGAMRREFNKYRDIDVMGATVSLYRMRPDSIKPVIVARAGTPTQLSDGEWRHLAERIINQKISNAAQNGIAMEMTNALAAKSKPDLSVLAGLTDATLTALYNYLAVAYEPYKFHVTLWRPMIDGDGERFLEKVSAVGAVKTSASRRIKQTDIKYQAVRVFKFKEPEITDCVSEAREAGAWHDFDHGQKNVARGLNSAIQLPIFRPRNKVGGHVDKEALGVLSVDCDQPDFFRVELLANWIDEFVGYLAMLALGEQIQRAVFVSGSPSAADRSSNVQAQK
jgi:hypothetical protein